MTGDYAKSAANGRQDNGSVIGAGTPREPSNNEDHSR